MKFSVIKRTLNENFSKNWEAVPSLISQCLNETIRQKLSLLINHFYGLFSTQKPKSDDNIKNFKNTFLFFQPSDTLYNYNTCFLKG